MPPTQSHYQVSQNRRSSIQSEDDESFDEDDERVPLTENTYQSRTEMKGWDVFVVRPDEDEDETKSSKAIEVILKIFKIFVYFFTFVVVLCTSVLSKATLLLITSNSKASKTLQVCNRGLGRGKEFEAHIPEVERIAWIWCLFFILVVPELFVLFRSTRICVFKSYIKPSASTFFMVFTMETLHTLGLVLLTFVVLPDLDVVKAAMLTNCLCTLPAFLSLLSRYSGEDKRPGKVILDLLALLAQVTGFVIWPLIEWHNRSWAIPLSVFLVSVGWWENYIDRRSPLACIRRLSEMKEDLRKSRYFTFIFLSIWKMLLIFCTMLGFLYMTMNDIGNLFRSFSTAFRSHPIIVEEIRHSSNIQNLPDLVTVGPLEKEQVPSDAMAPIYVALIQISASLICYVFAKFSCKICIQGFSFAFPVSLTIPVTISLLIAACGVRTEDSCFFQAYLPRYLFWSCPDGDFFQEFVTREHAWIWILWLLAQTWVAVHIWTPKAERLASTEKLFVNPMYVGALIDQSLALNRRRDDEGEIKSEEIDLEVPDENDMSQYYETISLHTETSGSQGGANGTKDPKGAVSKGPGTGPVPVNRSSDHITRIYACATMWHETSEEMIQMLKSIIRMDEDQSARRNAQKYLRIVDPDYYEFEVHVFFDDAFELSDDNDEEMVVNRFVKLMVRVIDTAASNVHECNVRLRPPKKLPTPYGGRLVWTLPGGNKLISHLKDKGKIRHRKRWSQVMYMYYLLGHRLMELPIDVNRKAVMAENTYILTLDGDINFRPHAVQLLVDLMKKNRNLGAACGRIHPVGTGPMVWYQMFEYAIGHWFQKATEHMIGCVLCSPGCFSLFRAKGLMDDNVMRRYTTKSDEPLHYVQYDQGEDRWLCTLLLQRGYRVEYSAASDAYTHCPEGFGEFYTQRRRWGPSTMANIMDLLCDYKRTVTVNDNISVPYIIYQAMLMIGTVLGPGTIFLMLVGAMVAAFKISNWNSFTYNIIPILFFMFVCFVANNNIQILLAQIMSAGYALLMMAVLVGTSIQLTEDGVGSPSSIFLIALSSSFFIAACLHPQEFWCVVPGFLYFLSVPSMYLLQIIYSLVNLNVVTWGTRETQTKKTKKEMEEEKKEQEDMKKKTRNDAFSWLGLNNANDEEEGSISISLANLFKCMFCTYPKPNDEKLQLARISDQLEILTKKLNNMERHVDGGSSGSFSRRRISGTRGPNRKGEALTTLAEGEEDPGNFSNPESMSEESERLEPRQERDDLINPYWIEDKDLKRGEVEYLSGPEIQFWKELIEKYLYPLDQNKEHQARVAAELKELRNKVVFAFFMTNALFILIVFLLQLNKDTLHIIWPLGVKTNITYIPETSEIRIDKEYLELEPIGLVFAAFFGIIMVVQFTAMLFHRFGTLSHILASVELNCFNRKVDDVSDEALIRKNAVQIAKAFQRLKGIDGDYGGKKGGSDDHRPAKRKTIHNLEKRKHQTNKIGTLDVAFRKRFMSFSANENPGKDVGTPVLNGLQRLSIRHDTLKALEVRRNTVFGGNPSRMKTLGVKNEYATNGAHRRPRPHVSPNRRADRLFQPQNGESAFNNSGYEGSSDEELGRLRMQIYGTGSRHSAAGSTYREENESGAVRRPSRPSSTHNL